MYYPQESPTYLQLSLCVSSNLQCHNKENSLYPEFFQRESLLYPKKSLSREYTSLKDYMVTLTLNSYQILILSLTASLWLCKFSKESNKS